MTVGVEGLYAFQWTWEAYSQRPEDAVTNTWHFENSSPYEDIDNVRDMLYDFYNVQAPNAPSIISDFYSGLSLTGAWSLKAYALEDDKPRAPVKTWTGNQEFGQSAILPTEVALVFSFQAAQESGLTQRRRRNRVYLGPFKADSNDADGRPESDLVATMLFAGTELMKASANSFRWDWHVYSPTQDAHYPVDNGWVDNAWDTQRRRGVIYTQRGSFNIDEPT